MATMTAKLNIDLADFKKGMQEAMAKGDDLNTALSKSISKLKVGIDTSGIKPAMQQVETAVQNTAEKAQSIFQKAFNFKMISDSIKTTVDGINQMQEPLKAIDKNARMVGTLGVENWKEVQDAAMKLQTEKGKDAAGMLDAYYDAVSAGAIKMKDGLVNVEESMKFMDTMGKLAVVGKVTTQEATNAMTGTMNAYGASLTETAHYADIMQATVKQGKTTIVELAGSLYNVVPTAAKAGISFEQVGAAIATVTKQGVPTAQATTQIRQALVELQKPGTNLANIMNKAGVSMESLKVDGLANTMFKLKKSMDEAGLSGAQTFSSIEAAGAFNNMTTGTAALEDLEYVQKQSAGAVAKGAALMADSIEANSNRAQRRLQGLVNEFTGALGTQFNSLVATSSKIMPMLMSGLGIKMLLPSFGQVKSGFASVVSSINYAKFSINDFFKTSFSGMTKFDMMFGKDSPLFQSTQKAGQWIKTNLNFSNLGKLAKQGASSVIDGFKSIPTALNSLRTSEFFTSFSKGTLSALSNTKTFAMSILQTLIPSLFAQSAAAGTTAVATTAAGTASATAGTATAAAWGVALAPILAVVAAVTLVAGGFYLLYKNSKGFKTGVGEVFQTVKGLAISLWDVIKGIGSVILSAANAWIQYMIAPFKIAFGIISAVFNTFSQILTDTLNAIFGTNATASQVFAAFEQSIKTVFANIAGFFNTVANAINAAVDWIVNGFKSFMEAIKPVAEIIISVLIVAFKVMWEIFKVVGGAMLAVIVAPLKILWSALSAVASAVKDVVVWAFEKLMGIFRSVGDAVSDMISWFSSFSNSTSALGQTFGFIGNIIQTVIGGFGALTNAFKKAGDMGTFVKAIMQGLSGTFGAFKTAMVDLWDGITSLNFNKISTALTSLPEKMAKGFDNGMNSVLNSAQKKQDQATQNTSKNLKQTSKDMQTAANSANNWSLSNTAFAKGIIESVELVRSGQKDASAALKELTGSGSLLMQYKAEISKANSRGDAKGASDLTNLLNATRATLRKLKKEQSGAIAGVKKEKDTVFDLIEAKKNQAEQSNKTLEADKKEAKTASEKLVFQQRIVKNLGVYKEALLDFARTNKIAYNETTGEITKLAGSTLKTEQFEKARNLFTDFYKNVKEQSKEAGVLTVTAKLEPFQAKEEARKLAQEISEDDYAIAKIQVEMGQINQVEFDTESLKKVEDEYSRLLQEENDIREKLLIVQDLKERSDMESRLRKMNALKLEKTREINKAETALNYDYAKSKLNVIQDFNKQEYELTKLEAEKERAEKLAVANLTAREKHQIELDYLKKTQDLSKDYAEKTMTTSQRLAKDFATSFDGVFKGISFDFQTNNSGVRSVEKEQSQLKNSYAKGAESYSSYITKMNDLDAKRTAEMSKQGSAQSRIWAKINEGLSKSFEDMNQKFMSSFESTFKAREDSLALAYSISQKQSEIADKNSKEYIDAENQKVNATNQAGAAMTAMYTQIGMSIATSTAAGVAAGKSALKSFVLATLDAVTAIVNVKSAEMLALALATPKSIAGWGVPGFALWGSLTAAINVALAVAKGAVNKMKFYNGGLKRFGSFGTGLIKKEQMTTVSIAEGNKPEYVINHKDTAKNMGLLEYINKGGDPLNYFKRELTVNNDNSMIVKGLNYLHYELIGIKKTLKKATLIKSESNYRVTATNNVIQAVEKVGLARC